MKVRLLTGILVPPEPGQVADPQASLDKLERRALLVYEGKFDSMDGEVTVTKDHLTKLVDNHNSKVSHLAAGQESAKDYPPIQLDHSTSARDTVGRVPGKLELGEFEGKAAVYGLTRFLGKENVEKVQDGRWTHLSVGADFESGTLEELTVTPFPAAPHASLLQKRLANVRSKQSYRGHQIGVTWDETEECFYPWVDGNDDWGVSFTNINEALQFARESVEDFEESASKGKFSKGDPMTDEQKERLRKHLMESTKCSKEEADEKISKMSKEDADAELSRLAISDKEAADAAKKIQEHEEAEQKAKMARKKDFVKMARGFKKESATSLLAGAKAKLSVRLAKLRAEAKITPAELKAIDLDKLAKLSKEAQEAVIESYDKRQPVIIPGQISIAGNAESMSHLAQTAEEKGMLKDMEGTMHFSKGVVKKLSGEGGDGPTSMDGPTKQLTGEAFPTSMDMHEQMGKHLEHMKHLLETQQHDEAKKHLETMAAHHAKMGAMGVQPGLAQPVVAPMDEKHLSALAENYEKLQNQFQELIRLAGPALEITESELDEEK